MGNENELDKLRSDVPRVLQFGVVVGMARGNRSRYAPDPDLPSDTVDVPCEFGHLWSDGNDRPHESDGVGLERVLEERRTHGHQAIAQWQVAVHVRRGRETLTDSAADHRCEECFLIGITCVKARLSGSGQGHNLIAARRLKSAFEK